MEADFTMGAILFIFPFLNLMDALQAVPCCPDCTWLYTCKKCGERFADMDDELDAL